MAIMPENTTNYNHKERTNAMKTLTKLATQRTNIPVLNTIKIINGMAMGTDVDQSITMPTNDLPDGKLLDAKLLAAGIVKDSGLPIADYPDDIKLGNVLSSHTIGQAGLEALQWVSLAMSKEETRYYLNGIYFDKEGQAVATDGHRMHVSERIGKGFAEKILPKEAVKYLFMIIKEHKEKSVVMDIHENCFMFRGSKDWTLVSKHIDGTFPDWRRFVPDYTGKLHVAWAGIGKDIVKKAKAIQGKHHSVKITQEGLHCGDDLLSADISLPVAIGFNASYMHDAGQGMISLIDARSPAKVTHDNGDYAIVMPLRV